jgi:hypothetical protein
VQTAGEKLLSHEQLHICLWQVNEQPGTYFWHGHAGNEKVDGFVGPLIVRPAGPEALTYDEEMVLFLSDNYHTSATALTFPLNRYFYLHKAPLCLCCKIALKDTRVFVLFCRARNLLILSKLVNI